MLGSALEAQGAPLAQRGRGPLSLGSRDNAPSAHLQLSGLSVVETFVLDVLQGGLDAQSRSM